MRKRWALALVLALVLALLATGLLEAGESRGKTLWQKKCPVWGGEVVIVVDGGLNGAYIVSCVIGD